MTSPCCAPDKEHGNPHGHDHGKKADWLLRVTLTIIVAAFILHFMPALPLPAWLDDFAAAVVGFMKIMWWGIVAGIIAVGLMEKVPREYFHALLGRGDTVGGLFRAALAGVLLDLCSHGILMVGAKLYERGASLAQVMTFLISSPWNSLSLTLILIALIGLKWALIFIAASVVVAIGTGWVFLVLTKRGILPANPHAIAENPPGFSIIQDAKKRLKTFRPGAKFFTSLVADGYSGGRMVLRWLFLGTIIAALIRVFVDDAIMTTYFGPTVAGLFLTLLATTIIEVCSEGSTPIAAELFARANAPGNAFAFLMAGVSTDYTEIMIVRDMTKSWKAALILPLVSVPQILLLGYIMNQFGGGAADAIGAVIPHASH